MFYPANIPLSIITRSTFDQQFQFIDQIHDAPINIAGYRFLSQLWDFKREIKYVDFTIAVIDAPLGILEISLTDEQTAGLTKNGYYDIRFESENGLPYYFVQGSFSLIRGYTDD